METSPLLVFLGGFLGAGKTTLMCEAARRLRARGQRVAVITNDQDSYLVDTQHASAKGIVAREIPGGCFCCKFSQLIEVADTLRSYSPHVIFAEPVGSCIDLSAMVLQPLKTYFRHAFRLAPLSVLIDPAMAKRIGAGQEDSDVEYLWANQVAEADLICTTKQDLYGAPDDLPIPVDFSLSARTGEGVDEWLKEVLDSHRVVGAHLLENIDYAKYARAEAALGWLNLHAEIGMREAVSPARLCGPLLERIDERLRGRSIRIAHLKVFADSTEGWIRASVTESGAGPAVEGGLMTAPTNEHRLALNLRAVADPTELREVVERCLEEIGGEVQIRHLRAFCPPEPKPEYRMSN